MKKIKIFIGSSIDELANDRNELARFLLGLNNIYVDRDLYFEGHFCEEASFAMQADGSQKQHNEYIENDADAAVFMFFTKAGMFTLEELDLARKTFLDGRHPNIFVFFKAVDSCPAATDEIKACVDKVANDYGHYFKMFESTDTIKLELLQFLVESIGSLELKVQDGKVYIGEEQVEDIDAGNVFAYQNSTELKNLKSEIDRLLSEMTAASAKGDATEALRISVKLGEAQKTYRELEKSILDMLKMFAEENKKGNRANPRRMEALRLLELGKIEEAKALISQEELNIRTESLAARKDFAEKQFADEANEIIEDALVRIQALKQDIGNINRFEEIETAYDSIYEAAQTAKRYDVIYGFASYLSDQKKYPKGIKIAEKLKYRYDHPDGEVRDEDKANLLSVLGTLFAENNDLQKAGKAYEEALEIARRLAEAINKSTCDANVAISCNNLANIFMKTDRPDDAEKLYLESLEILHKLTETVSSSTFEPDVAMSCNNLALLYENSSRPVEAEKLYLKALKIRRRLAETVNKSAYEPDVAGSCTNLAALYVETDRPDDAEKLFLEALKIYRRLAKTVNKESYEPYVAMACYNLALYNVNDKPKEAEKLFLEALEIRRRLAETVSRSAYEPDVAGTCNSLAALYYKTGRPDEADLLFAEAKELAAKYKDVNPVCRQIYNALNQ